jgi:putative transcriptional regulator
MLRKVAVLAGSLQQAHRLIVKPPTPAQIVWARNKLGLTQTQAAELIYCSMRGWQEWEGGRREMHPAFWELWNLKAKPT